MIEIRNSEDHDKAPDRAVLPGTVVVSKSGHDRGRIYLVIASDASFLFLADGDKRPFSKPKKKRRRQVSAIGQIDHADALLDKVRSVKVQADQSALIRKELTGFTASHGNP